MGFTELLFTAIALSADAMAVAICKGLAMRQWRLRHALTVGLWFGGAQALMPLAGCLLTTRFASFFEASWVAAVDHWVAFVLLSVIGVHMIRESLGPPEAVSGSFAPRDMAALAVATGIDAMVAGVALAARPHTSIWMAALLIGGVTFLLSAIGVWIGRVFGARFQSGAERVGGMVLIAMGVKTLLEDLGVLAWIARSFP